MKEDVIVKKTLEKIKANTGLKLKLCDYFTGVRTHNRRKYFNVLLTDKISESKEYILLKRFADKYKRFHVEPCGVRRVSIFINNY